MSCTAVVFLKCCLETDWTKRMASRDAVWHSWLFPLPPLAAADDAAFSPALYGGALANGSLFEDLELFNVNVGQVTHERPLLPLKREREPSSGSQPGQGDQKRPCNVVIS